MQNLNQVFDRDIFLKNLRHMCENFPSLCTIYQNMRGGIQWSYKMQDESYTYQCHASQLFTNLVFFTLKQENSPLIGGRFNMGTGRFTLDEDLVSPSIRLELETIDTQGQVLRDGVEHILKEYTEDFQKFMQLEVPTLNGEIEKEDVLQAMDDCYIKYSTFQATSFDSRHYTVAVIYNNIRVEVGYTEDDGKHDRITLRVVVMQDRIHKEVYCHNHFFTLSHLCHHTGERPNGFDEVFAKFKLFGALMN